MVLLVEQKNLRTEVVLSVQLIDAFSFLSKGQPSVVRYLKHHYPQTQVSEHPEQKDAVTNRNLHQRLHSPFFLADICVKSESNPICLRHICVKKYQKARIRNISRFATNTRIHDSDNPFHTNGRFYMTEVFD